MTLPDRILDDAVEAAGMDEEVTSEEIEVQRDRILALGQRDDDARWKYETHRNLGHIIAQLIHAELDTLDRGLQGHVEAVPIRNNSVPLSVQVESDQGFESGLLVHLSAEQAEALAVDLLEQAHGAREARTEEGGSDE